MVDPNKVRPSKWADVTLLYDDGDFSVITGRYDGGTTPAYGVRWNGDPKNPDDIGYPNTFGHPGWFVLPTYLAEPMLHTLLSESLRCPAQEKFWPNVVRAIRTAGKQIRHRSLQCAFALHGAKDTGKTTTLNILIDLLVDAAVGPTEGLVVEVRCGYNPDTKTGDRRVVVRVFGKTVAISTGGDDSQSVQAGIDFAKLHNADIYVAAVHKRSNSYGWSVFLEHIEGHGIPHEDIKKGWSADSSQAQTLAMKTARDLFNRIKRA